MHTLYTAGYQGFDQETFAWKLQTHGVGCVIDVRDSAFSRNRGFTQAALRVFFAGRRLPYRHLQALGAPAELRKTLRAGGTLAEYFAGYEAHLQTQIPLLNQLADLARQQTCCLMCLENNPEECHRSVLARVLQSRHPETFDVVHV